MVTALHSFDQYAIDQKISSPGFYLQAFNLLNHTNLGVFSGVLTSPFFGQATSAQMPRRMEVGMRFN